jgi:hypothetical protein
MKTFSCWDIQTYDGGDRTNHAFYVETEEEAQKWKEKNKFDHISETLIEVYATIDEYNEGQSKKTRQRALAKLTPVERKALGF